MADNRSEQAQAEPASFHPGTIVDGRYRVLRLIGGGGNGLVHEVEHLRTGQRLALKSLLDPTTYQRLEQEARATSLLKSNRAVKIVDMGMSPTDGPYLVMELLTGQNLRELLQDAGQLPLEMMINIAMQVGECLAEAHAVGIVHRDLKPDNIQLVDGPRPGLYDVKVLDFGIVKIASDAPVPGGSLTRTGSTVGTPYYMSLEQLRNPSSVDGRSDLYSLGVVLYECLTGRKPYDADTIGDLVYALCSGPPTDISRLRPDLPAAVGRAVMRALSPNREDRQSGVVELCRELAPHADRSLVGWLNDPPRPPASEPSRPSGSPFKPGGAPTPSGVRPILPSESTVMMSLPERESAVDPGPPRHTPKPAGPKPAKPVMDEPSDSGGRDTPTTFFVKGKHPEPPDLAPDSEKTRMLVEPSMSGRNYARPSEDIDDTATAPVKASDLAAAKAAFAPGGPLAGGPASQSKYTKTTPLDTSQFPELSGLSRAPDTSRLPTGPSGLGPISGMFQAPPVPPGGSIPGTSGMFQAPPLPPGGAVPGTSGMFQAPPVPPSGGLRPPGSVPGMTPGMIPGTGMPAPLLTSQANLPAMNIPGTTGPLPQGGGQPSWMAAPGQGAPPPAPGGGLMAFWQNATPKTQLMIAIGSATAFVVLFLVLLLLLVK